LEAKTAEADKNVLLLRQKTLESASNSSSNRVDKLARMMQDPQFAFLSAEQQADIRNAWFLESQK
jgi:hypothetical protein